MSKQKKPNNIFASWKHDESYKEKEKNGDLKQSKRFVGVPHSLLMHPNFIALKDSSKKVYLYMLDYSVGDKITTFPKSIYTKITSCAGFSNAIKELTELGFIQLYEYGKFSCHSNKYEFIEKWKSNQSKERKKRPNNFIANKK